EREAVPEALALERVRLDDAREEVVEALEALLVRGDVRRQVLLDGHAAHSTESAHTPADERERTMGDRRRARRGPDRVGHAEPAGQAQRDEPEAQRRDDR